MTASIIISLIISILKSLVIFYTGKILIHNRAVLKYLGIIPEQDTDILASESPLPLFTKILTDHKQFGEMVIARIGLLLQIIAVCTILYELYVTVAVNGMI